MKSLVMYGESLGAHRLVDIEGDGHFSISLAIPGIGMRLEILDELLETGLRTKYAFTLDPGPPLDFENFDLTPEQKQAFLNMYRDQVQYDARMLELGLRNREACTCTPYLAEVGNTPRRGQVLAWSESSCVVFANSVLGARTNRNAAFMDLLSNIVGKTPLTGLLTDEGRRATWLVEVKTSKLPNPQMLGSAIGMKVLEDIPYITGLDRFLGAGLNEITTDYLKEMGAACAAIGAVGLYHVENITPEATEQGTDLLVPGNKTYVIDDRVLKGLIASYPAMWTNKEAKPRRCLIGCPHLSLRELYAWTDKICQALDGQNQVAVETILFAAPQVLDKFKGDRKTYERLKSAGVKLSASCSEAFMDNQLCACEAVITNSCKLAAFTTARMFPDEELLENIVRGEVKRRA
jgi:predicted aconitase